MPHKITHPDFLHALKERVLVFDGAMGTNLQNQKITPEQFGGQHLAGCNDNLVLSYPQAVEIVHRSFLDVGVDVIETCSFRSNRITLAEYGLQDKTTEINHAAAKLARHLADEYSRPGAPRFVGGSIGPSGKLISLNDPQLSNISFDELADVFREQARGLIEGGVDLLVVETSQDILEVKATLTGIQQAFKETGIYLPIQAQVTLDTSGKMLLGTDISAVLATLEGFSIDVIGLNCSTGPDYMREPIQYLGENSNLPVSCIPNAGLPLNVDGQAVYPLEPQPFADAMQEFVTKFGVNVVGGCCGTTAEHMNLLVQAVHGLPQKERPHLELPQLSSGVQMVSMIQEPKPFIIGERLNSQGSLKFKKLLLAEDYESIMTIARQQVESGAHGLDICVALTERPDEALLAHRVIKTLAPVIKVPFILDTTEPDVMEMGLKTAPGRCLINSINLENGVEKASRVLTLAKKYNAAVIALTIDEQGMARTAERKLAITKRLYDLVVNQFELRPCDLVIDALTFTLATGEEEYRRAAIDTFDAIRLIKKELPGVLTSLGVSNSSFGLSPNARAVINSVMLYHAVQAGLDMAIVNPAQITPYSELSVSDREIAEDLIFNRRTDALARLIEYFSQAGPTETRKTDNTQAKLDTLSPDQRLSWRILHRIKENVENDIDELILAVPAEERSLKAVEVLNTALLPAMKEVGDQFGRGELILPFVLQSAEVMKKSVAHLEQYLDRQEGTTRGTLVLATVYGDVHDIGKNLVKTILSNNGFKVIDLGKQVPAETIISKAIEEKADAIGLSALLVSTSKQMPLIVNELQRRGLKIPVLIGGAAINRHFGRRIMRTEEGKFYQPGVYHCKDAFEGLAAMQNLSDPETRPEFVKRALAEAEMEFSSVNSPDLKTEPAQIRSAVKSAGAIPQPPTYGPKVVRCMPLDMVFQHLAKNELFRLSWGAKNTHGEAWTKLEQEYEQRLEAMRLNALAEGWLKPQGVYGYWPAQAVGDDLLVYEPSSIKSANPQEINRFHFARQNEGEHLCLADYFASRESGQMDVVAFQVVTVGSQATQKFDDLQNEGNYSEAYFTHGLAVQMAEASAEYLHEHIRQELGLKPGQGKRYSWGYPAIPDLADHARVFQLLPAEKELGMSLTSAFQLVPEQSTAAIILHHPDARYFSLGETRIDQLMRG
jgi:5-methyltetrahydrofolate--homocysteine methyltransferase